MNRHTFLFWPIVICFFVLWTAWVLYGPIFPTEGIVLFFTEFVRSFLIVLPFILTTRLVFRSSLVEAFALVKPTRFGSLLAAIYSCSLLFYESSIRIFNFAIDPWFYISLPFMAIAEELVFRGFIFTYLLHAVGRIQAILITTVLSTLFVLPIYIFVLNLQGEILITAIGQIFVFSLIQGGIRLSSKSVYPTIAVHLIRNFLAII